MNPSVSAQHQSRQAPASLLPPPSTGAAFNPSHLSSQPSLQPFTLAEMPEDLLCQLFQWVIRKDESESSVRAFGCVSSGIHQKLHRYLGTESHKEFMSDLIRQRGAKFANTLLDSIFDAYDFIHGISSKELTKITSMINSYDFDVGGRAPETHLYFLWTGTILNCKYEKEFISAFKNYKSPILRLAGSCADDVKVIYKIEKALPKHVGIVLSGISRFIEDDDDTLARFISSAHANDRMLGFDMHTDFEKNDRINDTILGAMCGHGFVPTVTFNVRNLVAALKHLTDHCQNFRHVQRLIIDWRNVDPAGDEMAALSDQSGRDILDSFIDALASRRENKKSELSVIVRHRENVIFREFFSPYMNDAKLNKGVSLYFTDQPENDEEFKKTVRPLVGKGPSDPWTPKSNSSNVDRVHAAAATNTSKIPTDAVEKANDLTDSDVIIESSDDKTPYPRSSKATPISDARLNNVRLDDDEDSITQSSDEESTNESDYEENPSTPRASRKPTKHEAPHAEQIASNEPRLKKRNKCVIS